MNPMIRPRSFGAGSTSGRTGAAAWSGEVTAELMGVVPRSMGSVQAGIRSIAPGRGASVPDPRIEQGVKQVNSQVDQDVGEAEQQDDALDHRVVPPQDGIHR